jgi:hypothetical protein
MRPYHWIILGILTVGTLLLWAFGPEHPYPHAWDHIPLFYAIFGFVGCLLIIIVSKALGKAFLQKKEDYYERDR